MPHEAPLASLPETYSSDEHFSPEEVLLLHEHLNEIEKFILETSSVRGALAIQVQQTFVYLRRKAETAGKLDWKNIFAGAIVSIILTLAVDNASAIFSLCNRLLAPLFAKLLQ